MEKQNVTLTFESYVLSSSNCNGKEISWKLEGGKVEKPDMENYVGTCK